MSLLNVLTKPRTAPATKTFKLGMSRDYVHGWGVLEACRELLQNAIDSQAEFEYTWSIDDGGDAERMDKWVLRLVSRNTRLPRSTLLLGNSGKRGDDGVIGKHGEGYKLAMLVLLREGLEVAFHNAGVMWYPEFVHDVELGTEVFAVTEIQGIEDDDLVVVVRGLTQEMREALEEQCLQLQEPRFAAGRQTSLGTILNLHPGKLFVGGLYVCDTEMKFGYNIKPEHIDLERDRRAVAEWELKSATIRMWTECKEWKLIAQMIDTQVPDVEWADVYMNERIRDACYEEFRSKHPKGIAVKSQEELERLVKKGFTDVRIVPSVMYGAVTSSSHYPKEAKAIARLESPEEFVMQWIQANKRYMNRYGQKALDELAEASRRWVRRA